MEDVTSTGIWKNNFVLQLDSTRQSMLFDAFSPLHLECCPCTYISLGLRSVEYLKEDAQNMLVWKVKAQRRGSERHNATAESHKARLRRKSVLKKEKLTL